jgi:glycosyltransferase involved in cell wall biosynthesis
LRGWREGNHHAERDAYGGVGLVGPLTNCASGYQQIDVGYTNLDALDSFSWEHAKKYRGQTKAVDRLIGFCLLIRREVIDQIGPFDERFGVGNFEDDDFCRRARDAGWRLVVAQDAFIHHFGHRTFDAAGIDLNALLERNQRIYDEKWADEGTGSYTQRVPGGQGLASDRQCKMQNAPKCAAGSQGKTQNDASGSRLDSEDSAPKTQDLSPKTFPSNPKSNPGAPGENPKSSFLSLCMIVRDNEPTIRAALESVRPWVDEMIVVDTGSTDATPDICRELGARLYHFPWPDSFSVARNESLKHARGEWIFWMDSDDVIDAENGRKLRALVGQAFQPDARQAGKPDLLGYVIQVHCPGPGDERGHNVTVVDHVKLFRNLPELRFEGRIHEQVLPNIRRLGGEIEFTDIFVVHAGADHSPATRRAKLKRDFRLLKLELRDQPDHPFTLFNLGMTYADARSHRRAIGFLRKSLAKSDPAQSQVRKVYALLASSYLQLGKPRAALRACHKGLQLFLDDPELLFRAALVAHRLGKLRDAERHYLALLDNHAERHFSSIDRGITGFKTRQNLAVVYTELGDLKRAEEQWRAIVAEVPDYRDGWLGLMENLLSQGDVAGAAVVSERLRNVAADASSTSLRSALAIAVARLAETRGDMAGALSAAGTAVSQHPGDMAARELLCRLLFQHGDPREIEKALCELIELDPANAAALHNLGLARLQRCDWRGAIDAFESSLRRRPHASHTRDSLAFARQKLSQLQTRSPSELCGGGAR